jgi:hypothetical protein
MSSKGELREQWVDLWALKIIENFNFFKYLGTEIAAHEINMEIKEMFRNVIN